MGSRGRTLEQDVADLAAWLDHATTMEVLRLLLSNELPAAFARLRQIAPDLDPERLEDPDFLEHLLDELELRVSPADDPEELETREVPDYARFARETDPDDEPRR